MSHQKQFIFIIGKKSVEEQFSSIISKHQQTVTKEKVVTKEDRARQEAKQAILNQYAEVSDGEAYPFFTFIHQNIIPLIEIY